MNTSKQEVNYRMPSQCCEICFYSGSNSYGDAVCKLLEYHDTIERGAVCDVFTFGNCAVCRHSFYDVDAPRCSLTKEEIKDAEYSRCQSFEDDMHQLPPLQLD